MSARANSEVQRRLDSLWRARPRSRFLRASLWLMLGGVALAWCSGEIQPGELWTERRRANFVRFWQHDATPFALRDMDWGLADLWSWAAERFTERGWEAMAATLWIATLAIVLSGIAGLLLAPLGARSLMSADPYLIETEGEGSSSGAGRTTWFPTWFPAWRALSRATRLGFIGLRAIPEYVWAYLFLAMLGPSAWPAVLALAIHNTGILGRLGSETIENIDRAPLRSLRMLGASRSQLALGAVFPLALPRYLLYFFYRFETCVREATVLGMLGVVSLGYWIGDARARGHYDEMLFFVALGSGLVLLGDLASQLARGLLRRGV